MDEYWWLYYISLGHHTSSTLGTQDAHAKGQQELAALQARIASLEKVAEAKTESRSQQLHETCCPGPSGFTRGAYTTDVSEDRTRRAVSVQTVRLVASMESFLHVTLQRDQLRQVQIHYGDCLQ